MCVSKGSFWPSASVCGDAAEARAGAVQGKTERYIEN
nr:MAG TPA: hypothetical protein [Caudoviricetes sp.]